MEIVILEDDEKVGSFIKENLDRDGRITVWFKTFNEFEMHLEETTTPPALFIMDRLIKNLDSKYFLPVIKSRYPESLIMFLSALNTPSEKAKILDEGADDYMGKPFSLVELQSRVSALLRRNQRHLKSLAQDFLQVGDLTIEFRSRSVLCQGLKMELTGKEYLLLLNFCENIDRVFTKFQLLDIIWETNLDIESNVLEVNIMNLRRKLERCQSRVKILSKRNIGYWLET